MFGLAASSTVLTMSDAEAQSIGMERRQARRYYRHGRRVVRRRLPAPGRAIRAYQTAGHLPVAVAHAFVLTRPTRGVGTSAQAIGGLILASRRVWHCFRR